MQFDIITLFPEMFAGIFDTSIISRARKNKKVKINLHQLRDWASDKHKTVDDTPYGGGAGMVIKVDVLDRCLKDIKSKIAGKSITILLSPQGKTFSQSSARKLSVMENIILICGHYEGFDQRIRDHLIDQEISIGDYVLTGGEIPAMVIVDTLSRLVPGVIKSESHQNESFSIRKKTRGRTPKLLEHPHYTKPSVYKNWPVPEILLSGDHQKIAAWRKKHTRKK